MQQQDTVCILPFIHVNSSVTGKYRPCCNTQKYFSFTDHDVSFKDAFESEEMENLRLQMLNGERPSICDVCWKNEDAGIRSQRQANNEKFREYPTDSGLQFLDIKFDNKCNLQCRMCDPYSSNQIWKSVEQLDELPKHLDRITMSREEYESKDNSEKRKQYVLDCLPEVRFLKCTGGEPLISEHFLEVVRQAVDTGHSKHITLSLTTNGTKFSPKFSALFDQFEAIDVNISVDGTNAVYDYIRYPFKYDQWLNRVIDFLTDMEDQEHPNFKVRFSTVVTSYNFLDLCNIQKEIDKLVLMFPFISKNRKNINFFDFDLRPNDNEFHAKFLPKHILLEGLRRAENFVPSLEYRWHPLESLPKFVHQHIETPTEKQELKRSTLIFDKQRNQTFRSLDPLLAEWIDE